MNNFTILINKPRIFSNLQKKFINILLILLLFCAIFNFPFFSVNGQPSTNQFKILGYGPIEGESGMPVSVQLLGSQHLAVLDLLKSSVIICNHNGNYVRSFFLSENLFSQNKSFSFRSSPDGYIFIHVQDQLTVYDEAGLKLHQVSLNQIPDYQSGISLLLPLSQKTILLFNPFTLRFSLCSLSDLNHSKPISFDASNHQFIDFYCMNDQILILGMAYNATNTKVPYLVYLDSKGDFQFQAELPYNLIPNPVRISSTYNEQVVVIGQQFHYAYVDLQGMPLSSGQLTIENHAHLAYNFCGFNSYSLLIPNAKSGILQFLHSDQKEVFLPVKSQNSQLLAPIAIAANNSFIATYDQLTQRFIIFQENQVLRSFYPSDLPVMLDQNSKIHLYASDKWLYIIILGINIQIFKYDPIHGKIIEIKLPDYIPPRSYVYVRALDDMIYIYSWFDGILYSFLENSPEVGKTVIKRHESVSHAQHSICKVDTSGNVFIFLSLLKKMNVYAKDGSLLFSFSVGQESPSQRVDFHFLDDYLIMLNQSEGLIEILSKRGEQIQQIGNHGAIAYPKKAQGYTEKAGSFAHPSSVTGFNSEIFVADTGNSRLQAILMSERNQRTIIELQIGSPSAYINGQRIALDAPPFIESGRTLVPLRFIGEAFGAKVEWFSDQQKAVISMEQKRIEVVIGSLKALIDGKEHYLDVPPMIRHSRTFVPLRFIGEAFGASIVWEAESKRIIMTYPGN